MLIENFEISSNACSTVEHFSGSGSGTETYDFDNHNRIMRSKHSAIQIRVRMHTHTWAMFSLLLFFGCHFHLFMLLLSISRAWIRYSSAGSSSLAKQRTSHGARAYCECVCVSVAMPSACVHMSVCVYDSFTRARVYACWANAMVCYTFCRTFLRLRYSDYLYESLKSVTLDWNARAYTISISKENKASEQEKKGKKFFWQNAKFYDKTFFEYGLQHSAYLFNFLHRVSLYAKAIKETTNSLPYSTRENTRENSIKIRSESKNKILNSVDTNY